MSGSGPHNFGQGQISGVGELAMCLLLGLVEGIQSNKNSIKFRVEPIVKYYKEWLKSEPSDIDTFVKGGLHQLNKCNNLKSARKCVNDINKKSVSNASLSRCLPLCIWGCDLLNAELFKVHKYEAEFVHTQVEVHAAIYLYSQAIQYLLKNPTTSKRCYVALKTV